MFKIVFPKMDPLEVLSVEIWLASPISNGLEPLPRLEQCQYAMTFTPQELERHTGPAREPQTVTRKLLRDTFDTLNGMGNPDAWERWGRRSLSVGDVVRLVLRQTVQSWQVLGEGWRRLEDCPNPFYEARHEGVWTQAHLPVDVLDPAHDPAVLEREYDRIHDELHDSIADLVRRSGSLPYASGPFGNGGDEPDGREEGPPLERGEDQKGEAWD